MHELKERLHFLIVGCGLLVLGVHHHFRHVDVLVECEVSGGAVVVLAQPDKVRSSVGGRLLTLERY